MKLIVLCLAGCITCGQSQAQGILGKIKKEAKEATKKDGKEETKTTTTTSNPAETNTGSGTSASQPQTKTAAAEGFTPVFELPETDSRRVTADAYFFPKQAEYAGKIVFSDKKLARETMTESMFRTSFNIDEPIYGRVFLKTAVKNYAFYYGTPKKGREEVNYRGNYHIRVYIDNVLQTNFVSESHANDGRNEGMNTWQTFISARGEDAKGNSITLIETINKLPEGTHAIKLEVYGGDWTGSGRTVNPLASGEFTVNKTAGKTMKQGLTWSVFKEGMVNPQLTKEALEVANNEAVRQSWKETYSKAKIKDKEWFIEKNRYGITVSRVINVYLYGKRPDGTCVMQEFTFFQRYGEGSFSKVLEYNAYSSAVKLDCDQ